MEGSKPMDVKLENHERRIEVLEKTTENIQDITLAIQEIALNLQGMQEVQKELIDRVLHIEEGPARTWERIRGTAITATVTAIVTAIIIRICSLM